MIGGVCLLCFLCSIDSERWHLCLGSLPLAEIGVGLTAFGLLFTVLGVLFFFDRGLLAMGNVRLAIVPHTAVAANGSCGDACTLACMHELISCHSLLKLCQ